FFFFQAEDGIRDFHVTGVQTCALPIVVKSICCRTCSSCAYDGVGACCCCNQNRSTARCNCSLCVSNQFVARCPCSLICGVICCASNSSSNMAVSAHNCVLRNKALPKCGQRCSNSGIIT